MPFTTVPPADEPRQYCYPTAPPLPTVTAAATSHVVLARIVDTVGWAALLVIRSEFVVMEVDAARGEAADYASSSVVSATSVSSVAELGEEEGANGGAPGSECDPDGVAATSDGSTADGESGDHARSPGAEKAVRSTPVASDGIYLLEDGSRVALDGIQSRLAVRAVWKTRREYPVTGMLEHLCAPTVWREE